VTDQRSIPGQLPRSSPLPNIIAGVAVLAITTAVAVIIYNDTLIAPSSAEDVT